MPGWRRDAIRNCFGVGLKKLCEMLSAVWGQEDLRVAMSHWKPGIDETTRTGVTKLWILNEEYGKSKLVRTLYDRSNLYRVFRVL